MFEVLKKSQSPKFSHWFPVKTLTKIFFFFLQVFKEKPWIFNEK